MFKVFFYLLVLVRRIDGDLTEISDYDYNDNTLIGSELGGLTVVFGDLSVDNASLCLGFIIDPETIVTSAKCLQDPLKSPLVSELPSTEVDLGLLSARVLKTNPMELSADFVTPSLLNKGEHYERFIQTKRYAIVIATRKPQFRLVRWYGLMAKRKIGELSYCEESYSNLQQENEGWPEFLPIGVFCIKEGNTTEDEYRLTLKTGANLTIRAGEPCNDTVGSPIIIPNEGIFGIVTAAYCDSLLPVTYAQSMAYIDGVKWTDSFLWVTSSNVTVDESSNEFPPTPYVPREPLIRVITTPATANRIKGIELAWVWGLGVQALFKIPHR